MSESFVFLNLSNLFSYVNLALGFSILLYLRHFISYQQIAQRSNIPTFVPILTPNQSYLFVTGFTMWTLALFMDTVRGSDYLVLPGAIRDEVAFFIHVTRPVLLTASTMFIGHALMVFAAQPVREGKKPPNLQRIGLLRQLGLIILAIVWILPVSIGPEAFDTQQNWMTYMSGLVLAQWMIVAHVSINLRNSIHPLRPMIYMTSALWTVNILAQMSWFIEQNAHGEILPSLITLQTPHGAWIAAAVSTMTLMMFLSLLLRANFLYVQETFRRASSFQSEKDVMISFLRRISEPGSHRQVNNATAATILEQTEIARETRIVLDFGREITNASGGVLFLRDDLLTLWRESRSRLDKGTTLSANALFGFYPPQTELSFLPLADDEAEKQIHELLRSEKIFLGEGVIGQIARHGIQMRLGEDDSKKDFVPQKDPRIQIRSWMAVPLRVQETSLAVLCLVNKDKGRSDFSHEDEATISALAEQAAISLHNILIQTELREKDRYAHEAELAGHVQQLLLPGKCPEIEGYDISAISSPAQEVGGDYYDFIWLSPEQLMIVVADVSDKGVPGALNMASVRSALRSFQQRGSSLKEIIVALNQFIHPDIPRGMFVSMLLVRLNIKTGQVEVTRAGHEPLIIQRHNNPDLEMLSPEGIALGVVNGNLFASNTSIAYTRFHPGDRMVLYTDGITESMNRHHEEYSFERFAQKLIHHSNDDAGSMITRIRDSISRFTEGMPQHDDQTLVVVQRKAIPEAEGDAPQIEG